MKHNRKMHRPPPSTPIIISQFTAFKQNNIPRTEITALDGHSWGYNYKLPSLNMGNKSWMSQRGDEAASTEKRSWPQGETWVCVMIVKVIYELRLFMGWAFSPKKVVLSSSHHSLFWLMWKTQYTCSFSFYGGKRNCTLSAFLNARLASLQFWVE